MQFGQTRPRGFLRVRLEQFFWLTEAMRFDDDGTLVELPATEQVRALIEARWAEAVATADVPDGEAGDAPAEAGPRRVSLPIVRPGLDLF